MSCGCNLEHRNERTMGDEAAEVPADNAMPCRTLAAIELGGCQQLRVREMMNVTSFLMNWAMSWKTVN